MGPASKEIMMLVAGTTAFTSWDLHNDVREKVLSFLKDLDGGTSC
jgi:hypothetical protein